MYMSAVTLLVAVLASKNLVFINYYLRQSMREINYTILNIAFCFSVIVAPFSLVVVWQPQLDCVVTAVAYNISVYIIKLINKKVYDLEDQNEISEEDNNNNYLWVTIILDICR